MPVTYILMYIRINMEASFNVCPGIVFNCGVQRTGFVRLAEYIMMSLSVAIAIKYKSKTNCKKIITAEI